tara:strand:+ start:302 stop:625 length:324 start_codon:yes stop_codon:yes gene_type:complete
MKKPVGISLYKQYWEDQANFMDKEPWAKDKIIKINLLIDYEKQLKELGFSNHSLSKEDKKIFLRIKIPYNYYELDDFETKVLKLLGIKENWLISISVDDSHCNSSRW